MSIFLSFLFLKSSRLKSTFREKKKKKRKNSSANNTKVIVKKQHTKLNEPLEVENSDDEILQVSLKIS